MNYLYGDSSESGLDFNYLAFLREALDCTVVLVELEASLGSGDRKKAKEKEAHLAIQSIEELGRHAAELFDPVIKAYAESPVGRAAAGITAAVRDVIATESGKVKTALGSALETLSAEDSKLRARITTVVDKLLRAYELPVATRAYELAWDAKVAPKKIQIAQRTPYGVDAVMDAALPAASVFATADLRVDKLADNVEISSVEAGGWIKKSDKLVPYKLGRYFVTRVVVGGRDGTHVRLRLTQDANAPGFNVIAKGADDFALERVGDNHEKDSKGREYTIDDRNRPALRALVDKVETAARAIGAGETRTLVSVTIDGAPLADAHPQVLAERLVAAMAPTVRDIAAHSSNANELVLRRMTGEDRREEIFVAISELTKKLDVVPEASRSVFAPLGIDRRSMPRPARTPTQPPQLPIAGVAAITAAVIGPDDDPLRRTRATAGPATRPAPPRPPPATGSSGAITSGGSAASSASGAIESPRAKATSGPVPLPGLTPPSTSSPAIAIPRTVSSETIDPSTIEELDDEDVKASTSGSVKIADLTRAIDAALDKADAVPIATKGGESKRAAAVIVDETSGGGEDV